MAEIVLIGIAASIVVLIEWVRSKRSSDLGTSSRVLDTLPLAVLLLLGTGLRAYAVYQRQIYAPALGGDEIGYSQMAMDLLAGKGFTWPGRTPLFPLWIAAVYAVSGQSVASVWYAQLLPGAASILLTYWIGRELFGRRAGLAAAFLVAADLVLIRETPSLYSEAFYLPFLLTAALALVRAYQTPTMRRFAWAGAWIGLCSLIRPTTFLLPVFLLIPLLALFKRPAWRQWATLMATSMLVMAPWMAYTTARYHAFIPLATSNAFLWQGSPEYYHLIHDQGYTYLDVWEKVIYGPDSKLHDPGSVEGDRWWTQRALRSIQAEPGVYLRFAAEKLVTFWVGDPAADWSDSRIFNLQALRGLGFSRKEIAQILAIRILPLLLPVMIAILWKRRWSLLPVYTVLAYFNLLHAATHAEARLSEPLQPLVLVVFAGAVFALIPLLQKKPVEDYRQAVEGNRP